MASLVEDIEAHLDDATEGSCFVSESRMRAWLRKANASEARADDLARRLDEAVEALQDMTLPCDANGLPPVSETDLTAPWAVEWIKALRLDAHKTEGQDRG